MAAGALREERRAAARGHGRPPRGPLLRRPRARPGRAGDDVDARPAADGQHDGPGTRRRRCPRPAPPSPRRSTPTRCAATCSPSSPTGAPTGPATRFATRDSLHEHDMWAVEGLTHRYPTKVLAEMLPTCPQYCGHCTRMDLVGNSTPQVLKLKLAGKPVDRYAAMLDYLHRTRASVTSSSPAVTSPTCRGRTSRPSSTGSSRSRRHPRRPPRDEGAHGAAAALAPARRRRGRRAGRRRRPARAGSRSPSTPTSTPRSR